MVFTSGEDAQNGDFYLANFRQNGSPTANQANYANDQGIYNQGLEVAAFLRKLHEVRGKPVEKFIIVAHSMGACQRAHIFRDEALAMYMVEFQNHNSTATYCSSLPTAPPMAEYCTIDLCYHAR